MINAINNKDKYAKNYENNMRTMQKDKENKKKQKENIIEKDNPKLKYLPNKSLVFKLILIHR